jgi:hypothetical protein
MKLKKKSKLKFIFLVFFTFDQICFKILNVLAKLNAEFNQKQFKIIFCSKSCERPAFLK